jgi:hypothetical protein
MSLAFFTERTEISPPRICECQHFRCASEINDMIMWKLPSSGDIDSGFLISHEKSFAVVVKMASICTQIFTRCSQTCQREMYQNAYLRPFTPVEMRMKNVKIFHSNGVHTHIKSCSSLTRLPSAAAQFKMQISAIFLGSAFSLAAVSKWRWNVRASV